MKRNQKGSAMIVVVCILVLTMALSLALLLTASVLITNAARSNNKEQCRINAVTVSDLLIQKIEKIEYSEETGYAGDIMPSFNASNADSSLEGKLKTIWTSSWKYYSEDMGVLESLDGKERRFTYKLKEDCGLPGSTEVELYYVSESGLDLDDYDGKHGEAVSDFLDIILYVKVTSTVGEETASIINSFKTSVENTGDEWERWGWDYRGRVWEGQEEKELGKGDVD